MRIGISTFVMDKGRSGIATYVRELARHLQLVDAENAYEFLMARRDAERIALTNMNFAKRLVPSFVGQPLVNLVWHNTALAARRDLDVVHVPSARRVPLVKGARVVATVHDLAAFSVAGKYDAARMAFHRKVVPAMIRRADHVITVSEFTKRDLMEFVGYPEERISVIYSGIDHGLFRPVERAAARDRLRAAHGIERPFFVYVSRLEHPAKNHVGLIAAFERFKLENDSAHQLVLVGADWPGAAAIKARAAESPARADILFPGFVPRETLPLLYSACDLMVFPSLFEGFGFPIIEALACGAPVICSNTSSMREIAADVVPTFDPADPEALRAAMERTVAHPPSAAERDRGMAYARRFDWRNTAQCVMEVYRSAR